MAPRVLYVVTEDWYFLSHRLPMARAAKAAGYEVHVATRIKDGRARDRLRAPLGGRTVLGAHHSDDTDVGLDVRRPAGRRQFRYVDHELT